MSRIIEKDSAERRPSPESEQLLQRCQERRTTSGKGTAAVLPAVPSQPALNPRPATTPLPSIVVEDVDGNGDDDDPPPYTAIPPPNHVGWTFDFSSGISYSIDNSGRGGRGRAEEADPLPFHPEGSLGQHTSSISFPLPPYRFFKFGSHRSLFLHRQPDGGGGGDSGVIAKDDGRKKRRYGAILVAGAVIVFLMALSLMVRFIVERSFWRG